MAFCPDYSGTFAAGSYSGNVAIYSEDTGGTQLQHLEGVTGGGVTQVSLLSLKNLSDRADNDYQVAFHPLSPTTIFVASRRSDVIQVFDLRDTSTPIAEMARDGDTNQRLTFDVDPWGRYLASGDQVSRHIISCSWREQPADQSSSTELSRYGISVISPRQSRYYNNAYSEVRDISTRTRGIPTDATKTLSARYNYIPSSRSS